jgi:cell division protease FtsH
MSAYSLDFSNEDLGNEALTDLFSAAARNAPSLVIFEDLDRLYGKGGGRDNCTKITLQHLLNCLDGLGTQDGVIVVATANDPTALDPAILRRPGRFDRIVPFPPPSLALRQEYLHQLSLSSLSEQSLRVAAHEAEGFSFAQLRESYILAGQLAFRRGDEVIQEPDLLEGIRLVRLETQKARSRTDGQSVGFGLPASEASA